MNLTTCKICKNSSKLDMFLTICERCGLCNDCNEFTCVVCHACRHCNYDCETCNRCRNCCVGNDITFCKPFNKNNVKEEIHYTTRHDIVIAGMHGCLDVVSKPYIMVYEPKELDLDKILRLPVCIWKEDNMGEYRTAIKHKIKQRNLNILRNKLGPIL